MANFKILLKNILLYFLSFTIIELLFHILADFDFYYMTLIRILLFNLGLSFFWGYITSLFDFKKTRWLLFTIVLIFAIYAFVELEFKHLLSNYYSFNAVSDGAGRVFEYVLTFIKDAKLSYWTVFIIPIIILILILVVKDNSKIDFSVSTMILSLLIVISCISGSYFSLNISNTSISLANTYKKFNNIELLIDKLGLNHFLVRDVSALFIETDNTIDIVIESPEPEDDEPKEYIIDDDKWLEDFDNEENSTIKQIDQYFMSRAKNKTNEHTGEFKDYNFIYFLVESLDYMAIDKDLTPTLYKMMNEGYWFKNHYTPKYSCTTGESEFIANVSLVPYNDACTPNDVPNLAYQTALATQFKNAGYNTYSFHNWYDQFYDRKTIHDSFGFDAYYNLDDLDIDVIQGWQSDIRLIEESVPKFIDSDRFFSFIISSTMHWPYDEDSTLGNKYLDEVNSVHPDYPIEIKRYLSKSIEFDRAVERLIELLEENDKLDNTIICLYSDHNPFKLWEDTIAKYSLLMDRTETFAINKTPFIMYNPSLKATAFSEINSTFDQVPTICNLFDLNYDARLYMGHDLFNDESIVIFPSSSWITKDGIYVISTDEFIPFGSKDLSSSEIERINNKVANAYSVSYSIYRTDYFKYRPYLGNPKYKEVSIDE